MDSIGESSIEDIPDTQLEYYCVKIPALMYRAGVKLEEFGLMADISSSQKRQEYNEAMLKVSGTVQERKARVEQLTEDKALVEVVYKRKDLKYRVLKMRNVVGIVVRVSLAVKSTVLSVGLNIGDL